MRTMTPDFQKTALINRVFVTTAETAYPHLWLHAPVGYGKTIAAQQIAIKRGIAPIILRLDTAHGDISYLLESLIARYCEQKHHTPFAQTPQSLGAVIEHIVRHPAHSHAEKTSSKEASKVCLLLENFETIAQAADARDGLARAILDHLPDLDFIITSQIPPTGIWQRLTSCKSFNGITADQLAFSRDELLELVQKRLSLPSPKASKIAEAIYEQSHGWPSEASYALEQLYRSHDVDPDRDLGQLQMESNDLFATELIANSDRALQNGLELLSLLPPLPMAQIVALLGMDITSKLDAFRQETSLLHFETTIGQSEAGPDQARLTLHPRLRTLLNQRPSLYSPERQSEISHIAQKLQTSGQEDLALDLLINAHCFEAIAGYLMENGQQLLQTGRLVQLSKLLAQLPSGLFEQLPPLKFFRGITTLQINPFESIADFEASYAFAKRVAESELAIHSWAMLIDAIWFAWSDGAALDPLIDDLPTIQRLVEQSGNPFLQSVLSRGAFTALSLRQPDHPDFKHWEQQSLLDLQKQAPRHEVARRGTQMLIHLIYGPADKYNADLVLRRVRQFHDGKNETAADHCSYYVVKSSFDAWFSSDNNAGPTIAYTGLNVSADLGVPYWDALLINAALYRLAPSEDRASISTFIELLEERIGPTSRSQDSAILHHFLAYEAWLDGKLNQAEKAITLALNIVTDSGFVLAPLFFKPGHAVILHEQGKTEQALELLEQTITQAIKQHTLLAAFIAKMVKAFILTQNASKSEQKDAIKQAFTLGAETELMSVPWLRIEQRNSLCKLAINMDCEADYAQRLMDTGTPSNKELATETIQIRTLGVPDILKDGTSILTSRKPQKIALLAISHLVASGKSGIASERMIELLWPEAEPDSGRQRLKAMLYRLRGMLGDKDMITVNNGIISLNHNLVFVDTWQLISASQSRDMSAWKQAVALYNGIFFDGFLSHPDLVVYRAHLETLAESILLKIANQEISNGDWIAAFETYENGLHRVGANMTLLDGAEQCLAQSNQAEKLKAFYDKWSPAFRDAFDIEIATPEL